MSQNLVRYKHLFCSRPTCLQICYIFVYMFYIQYILYTIYISTQPRLEKITSSVQETSVSRHHGYPINGPPQTSHYDIAAMARGASGGHSLGPHDAESRLSDSCTSDRW